MRNRWLTSLGSIVLASAFGATIVTTYGQDPLKVGTPKIRHIL